MSIKTFEWFDEKTHLPVRICISDKLEPLLSHSHNEIEFMYFYNTGGGQYCCNEKYIDFSKNDLIVVNPGEAHSCDNWGENCCAACITLNASLLSVLSVQRFKYVNKISSNCISSYFNKLEILLSDANMSFEEKECRINSIVYNILGSLSRYKKYHDKSKLYDYNIKNILTFIDENIYEDLTVKSIAEKFYFSKDRFSHLFKESIGISPIEYIIKKRVERACRLLENTDMSIQEIAGKCNFCTASYFSKTFFRHTNKTPKEYRKQYQKNYIIVTQMPPTSKTEEKT